MALSGWNTSQKIAIAHDISVVDEDLPMVPILVKLSSSSGKTSFSCANVFTKLGTNSKKIAVEIGDTGDQCFVEIENWDSSGGVATLWVLVPVLYAGTTVTLNLYYDETHADNNAVDSNVKLLIQDSIKDYSNSDHAITANGNASLVTFNSNRNPLVNNSGFFNGTAYLTVADHIDLTLGSSDFCYEVVFISWSTGVRQCLLAQANSSGTNSSIPVDMEINSSNVAEVSMFSGSTQYLITGTTNLHDGKIHLVACVRHSDTLYLYVDGVSEGTPLDVTGVTANNSSNYLAIGRLGEYNGIYFTGYIFKVRVSTAVSRYPSGTSFAIPTEFISDANTKLLINFTETGWGQGLTPASFTDSGNTGHTVTNVASTVSGCTFWWGRSLTFDGSTGYLTIPDSDEWFLSTGDFTTRFKYIFTDAGPGQFFWSQTVDANNRIIFYYTGTSGSQFLDFYAVSSSVTLAYYRYSWVPVNNKLYDIELVRSGSNLYLFIDGDLKTWTTTSTAISTNSLPNLAASLYISSVSSGGQFLSGIVNGFEWHKGVALHTTSFTPPSQPTNIGYIGDSGSGQAIQVWDEYYRNVYHNAQDPSGTAPQILDSTGYQYHGTSAGTMTSGDLIDGVTGKAIDYDGTDDEIDLPETGESLSNGTVEFIVKASSATIYDAFWGCYSNVNHNLDIDAQSSSQLHIWEYGVGAKAPLDFTLTDWAHGAMTLSGGTNVKLFNLGAATSNTGTVSTGVVYSRSKIGHSAGQDFWPGAVDEIRISNVVRSDAYLKATYYSNTDNLLTFTAVSNVIVSYIEQLYDLTELIVNGYVEQLYNILTRPDASYIEQIYGLYDATVRGYIEQLYNILASVTPGYIEQIWGIKINGYVLQRWHDVSVVQKSLVQYYGDAAQPLNYLLQEWDDALQVKGFISQHWSAYERIHSILTQLYAMTEAPVVGYSVQPYAIKNVTEVLNYLTQPYLLLGTTPPVGHTATLTVGGNPVAFSAVSVDGGRGQYCLTCDFTLSSQVDYLNCNEGDDVVLVVDGDTFEFFVDEKPEVRTGGTSTYNLRCLSHTAKLDAPYADVLQDDVTSGMASTVFTSLASPYPVDWQLGMDWFISSNDLHGKGETPLTVMKRIVDAVRAVIQSSPETGIIVKFYNTMSPELFNSSAVVATLSDDNHFVSTNTSKVKKPGYNKYVIKDEASAADSLRLEVVAIEGSTTSKEVRLYVNPWEPQKYFTLGTSGGSWVSITAHGYVEQVVPELGQEAELVEFVNSTAQTQKPVYGMMVSEGSSDLGPGWEFDWLQANLGSITYTESGVLTASVADSQSLLQLRYTTKYYKWIVRSPRIESVQFYVEEV